MQDQTTKLPQLGNWETTRIKGDKETTKNRTDRQTHRQTDRQADRKEESENEERSR